MRLKKQDRVKLLPSWPLPESPSYPIWGGSFGFVVGTVEQTYTHEHDPAKHIVEVRFSVGAKCGNFPESALAYATEEDEAIALDYSRGIQYGRDVWVLIRTSRGNFSLNVIEANNPLGLESREYVVGVTRTALSSTDNSDFNLVDVMLSSKDYRETKVANLYSALAHIHYMWNLPPITTVPAPFQGFRSIKEAVASAPADGKAAILMFHLPCDLADFSEPGSNPPIEAEIIVTDDPGDQTVPIEEVKEFLVH